MTPRILAFAGSLRSESFNKKLVRIAANAARDTGAEVTPIDLIVLPDQIAVARAHEAFQPDGSLSDPKQQAGIEALGKALASILMKLRA